MFFIAGLRRIDRTRGSGWLDCPNCHEHAAQDVIDEMRFLDIFGYRLAPVSRKRVLLCRRCGFRRPAAPELSQLETGGRPIHRAWLVPIGLIGVGCVVGLIALISHISSAQNDLLSQQKIDFTDQSGAALAPFHYQGPSAWNYDALTDQDPPYIKVSDSGGRMWFSIRRVIDASSLDDILNKHFNDEVGLTTTGFPDKPPDPKSTTIAGQKAQYVVIDYSQGAEKDQQQIYVVQHNGVGYVLTYVALGSDAITTMDAVAKKVNDSFGFTGSETPPPATPEASPSPGASPGTSPGASPSPSP